MKLAEWINQYQGLIGSFLAIVFSISFWYFKEGVERRTRVERHGKEIENIFLMAARESEESVKNLENYVKEGRTALLKNKNRIALFTPNKFNRIYVNEDRLFALKSSLAFSVSQQIDIAVSAAKTLNSYFESFENGSQLIFDGTMKLLELGLITKEQAITEYHRDQSQQLDTIEKLLRTEIETGQRHLLRPLAAQAHTKQKVWEDIAHQITDESLDNEADLLLRAVKMDLA